MSIFIFSLAPVTTFGVTQTGGGYIVNGQMNSVGGAATGLGGYTSQAGSNPVATYQASGNGYELYGGSTFSFPFDECQNISGMQFTVPSGMTQNGVNCVSSSSGGGGGGGSMAKKCSLYTTGTYPNCVPIICPEGTSGVYPLCSAIIVPTLDPTKNIMCSDVLVVAKPIRFNNLFYRNNPEDVKIVEKFLNTYEGENLVVDGVYSFVDFQAVIRWQEKYSATILKPWGLTKGTGYVYLTSIAQMKRQQLINCDPTNTQFVKIPDTITVMCPYFTTYHNLGSTGPEVVKIQEFLNRELNTNLIIDGQYDYPTKNAVRDFQTKYRGDILSIWNLQYASGWWYKSTIKKANDLLGCRQ